MNYKAIIIASVMFFIPLSRAMEIPTKNSKIRAIHFSQHGNIIIAGDYCCDVYSPKAQSSFTSAGDDTVRDPIYDMVFSHDKKVMALVKEKKIVVYDMAGDKTKKVAITLNGAFGSEYRISFDSNMLRMCDAKNYPHIINSYNYIAGRKGIYQTFRKRFKPSDFNNGVMAAGDSHPIIITDFENRELRKQLRAGDLICHVVLPFTYSEKFPPGEFNYDGTLLAINMSGEKYRFIDGTLSKVHPFGLNAKPEFEISTKKNENEDIFYISIAFHKNNITAALLKNNGCIEFWDYRNKTLLGTMYCKHGKKKMLWQEHDCRDQLLSFSHDGKQFVASVGRKVYLYQTPREAICMPGTKKHGIALLFALQNYFMEIPRDVICNIIANFLWCSEFGNEKKATEMIFKIISKNESKVTVLDAEAQEVSDEEDNDFCTSNLKKIYLYSMMVLVGISAMCTLGS